MLARRILIDGDPFVGRNPDRFRRGRWPARWLPLVAPVTGFRLAFDLPEASAVTLHVSADERYRLFLDGGEIGRGPQRAEISHWPFDSVVLDLDPGSHLLAAQVWAVADDAPVAQQSAGGGFILAAEAGPGAPDLATGSAAWQVADLPGHLLLDHGDGVGCGARWRFEGGSMAWGWERGVDRPERWSPAVAGDWGQVTPWANDVDPGPRLVPAALPDQLCEPVSSARVRHVGAAEAGRATTPIPIRAADHLAAEAPGWQALLAGEGELEIPARTTRRVLVDLDDYVCADTEVQLRGGAGAQLRVHWQEALYLPGPLDGVHTPKGSRDDIEGKHVGRPDLESDELGDTFVAGGGVERHRTLWWSAGRYVELLVTTADEPLTLADLRFVETRYPYRDESTFSSPDPGLSRLLAMSWRTLQLCSHETTMDCPYYEQLQYAGDTRLQLLAAYTTSDDDRLGRQAIRAFARARDSTGLTPSRAPSRNEQRIPPFALWWVAMVHDFALWRGDLALVAEVMPAVRSVLDEHRRWVRPDGLLQALPGWNFMDWCWPDGAPPDAQWGVSGPLHLQYAGVLRLAGDLEAWLGEPELAARQHRHADSAVAAAEAFFDSEQGLYRDDLAGRRLSRHSQALAVLAGARHGAEAMAAALDRTDLTATTYYFDHYWFEALARIGRTDQVLARLAQWQSELDPGLRTIIEHPEPTRSDCHAWGAHPLFHRMATLLGVRPTAPGMSRVRIDPQPGGLRPLSGRFPTPHGTLSVSVSPGGAVEVELPAGIEWERD